MQPPLEILTHRNLFWLRLLSYHCDTARGHCSHWCTFRERSVCKRPAVDFHSSEALQDTAPSSNPWLNPPMTYFRWSEADRKIGSSLQEGNNDEKTKVIKKW